MAVFWRSFLPAGDRSELPVQGEDTRAASRCLGEASGQTSCCGQCSLRHWMWPGPWEGGKEQGWESKAKSLPCLACPVISWHRATGGPRGPQSSWGSPSPYLVVEGSVQALYVLFWRKAEDAAEAGI